MSGPSRQLTSLERGVRSVLLALSLQRDGVHPTSKLPAAPYARPKDDPVMRVVQPEMEAVRTEPSVAPHMRVKQIKPTREDYFFPIICTPPTPPRICFEARDKVSPLSI